MVVSGGRIADLQRVGMLSGLGEQLIYSSYIVIIVLIMQVHPFIPTADVMTSIGNLVLVPTADVMTSIGNFSLTVKINSNLLVVM